MSLQPGYYYCVIDGYTFETNPLTYDDPTAEKDAVDIKTLTSNITLHWKILDVDQVIFLEWGKMSKTMRDTLDTKYKADYVSYSFTDIHNNSYQVVIKNFRARRITNLDEDGYTATMELKIVG
ncbi:MAG: hypothetical protein ACTSPD_10450 [Promethearchaeota archaeon]